MREKLTIRNYDNGKGIFSDLDNVIYHEDEYEQRTCGWELRHAIEDNNGHLSFFVLLGSIRKKYNLKPKDMEYIDYFSRIDMKEKELNLTLDYLYPLLRDGKLKLKFKKRFNNPEEVKEELQKVKTEDQKSKLEELLNNDNIYWNREQLIEVEKAKHNKLEKLENVDWNKEPIVNYVFYKEQADLAIQELKRYWEEIKHDEEKREEFEEFNVMFTLPENKWWDEE